MRIVTFVLIIFLLVSCKNSKNTSNSSMESAAEALEIEVSVKEDSITVHENSVKDFREFKVLDSKYINASELWKPFNKGLENFTEEEHKALKPFILEQDIESLQKHIASGKLSYELLTKFYLFRIRKFDRENSLSLNSVISLNPNVIEEAKQKDIDLKNRILKHTIFGMPIILKDNINASGMPTTAGAIVLKDNNAEDAFIVTKLKSRGAIILGKANLSEWANFFCQGCPNGFSNVGGQTLNPYGRRQIDTGGSSSGSAVTVAANFCVAAVGSETSGSILSPASQNSVVGLKPTIGLISRGGIVPISSTLDTPGPITKNVKDAAILLDVMFGQDAKDEKSIYAIWETGFYTKDLTENGVKGKRFGAYKSLMEDVLYVDAIAVLKKQGAEIVEIEGEDFDFSKFLNLLNLDMRKDLPVYLKNYADASVQISNIQDVIDYNVKDTLNRAVYGQAYFKGIIDDTGTDKDLESIIETMKANGKKYFDEPMQKHQLDGVLSINNYHASYAAVAEYPAITIPMGYNDTGEPEGLTIIGGRIQEKFLLQWAYAYEQASKKRLAPENYN